jgi:nucleoside-diphosphate-sugar epimerase
VVEACAAAESVKRLVFTSSVSAIVCGRRIGNLGDGEIMDEECWTNLEFCREKKASRFTS